MYILSAFFFLTAQPNPKYWFYWAILCYVFITLTIYVNLRYLSSTLRKRLYKDADKKKKKKKGAVRPTNYQGTTKRSTASNGLGMSSASSTLQSSKLGSNSKKTNSGASSGINTGLSGIGMSSASSRDSSRKMNTLESGASQLERLSGIDNSSQFASDATGLSGASEHRTSDFTCELGNRGIL